MLRVHLVSMEDLYGNIKHVFKANFVAIDKGFICILLLLN